MIINLIQLRSESQCPEFAGGNGISPSNRFLRINPADWGSDGGVILAGEDHHRLGDFRQVAPDVFWVYASAAPLSGWTV